MNKVEFLAQLRKGLSMLPQEDIEERLTFYSEMIDDQIEEGLSEEEAVFAAGSVDDIVKQVISDISPEKISKERIKLKRHIKAWEIILLALGAPVWFSLVIAAIVVIFSLYVSLWSVIVSLWAVFGSFVAGGFAGLVSGIAFLAESQVLSGIIVIDAAIVLSGLSIFIFYGCKATTKGTLKLTKKIAVLIKSCFSRKVES